MIYFVWATDTDRVKIGRSGAVDNRLSGIATDCPYPVQLLGTLAGNKAAEKRLHTQFATNQINREWFLITPELVQRVKRSHLTTDGALWVLLRTEPRFAADYAAWKGTWREPMARLAILAHMGEEEWERERKRKRLKKAKE